MCDKIKNIKVATENFERSENFYGHESVQALWHLDAVRVALNHRIYLVHAIGYNFFVFSAKFHNQLFKPIDFSKTHHYEIALKSTNSEGIKTYLDITLKYKNSSFKQDKNEEFRTFLDGEMRI